MSDQATSEVESRLRNGVAVATRLLNGEGILGYSGHISVRIPGRDELLIQPIDESRATLAPEQILLCGMDGTARQATNAPPPAEIFIHTEVYRARPDVNAVAHFHHELTTVFSLVEDVSLVPVKNHAARWESGIPTHPDPSHVSSPEKGRALAQTLGPHHAALIRAHGQVIVAEDLGCLFSDCIHFVENAEALYRAAAIGKVKPLTGDEMAAVRSEINRERHAAKLWKYYLSRSYASGVVPEAWRDFGFR